MGHASKTKVQAKSDALNAFGADLNKLLSSFGITFKGGELSDEVVDTLFRASQA